MSNEALRDTLARLHAELERAGPIDSALRDELEQTLAEILEVMERGRANAETPLGERLEEVALRFERSHPGLAQAIGSVVNALSTMGI